MFPLNSKYFFFHLASHFLVLGLKRDISFRLSQFFVSVLK